ncbi:MAG TPA: hypothetical protein DEP20_00385 [Fusobacteria bacterium]|nr:hypothetical protein [Fusobacteriota bacterium]|tara:strand:+ start:945 stop:2138 length:1194 start_codon:yes stop_codon:yes gene_type:complete
MTNLLFILLFHSICGLSFAEADFDEIDRQEDNISDDFKPENFESDDVLDVQTIFKVNGKYFINEKFNSIKAPSVGSEENRDVNTVNSPMESFDGYSFQMENRFRFNLYDDIRFDIPLKMSYETAYPEEALAKLEDYGKMINRVVKVEIGFWLDWYALPFLKLGLRGAKDNNNGYFVELRNKLYLDRSRTHESGFDVLDWDGIIFGEFLFRPNENIKIEPEIRLGLRKGYEEIGKPTNVNTIFYVSLLAPFKFKYELMDDLHFKAKVELGGDKGFSGESSLREGKFGSSAGYGLYAKGGLELEYDIMETATFRFPVLVDCRHRLSVEDSFSVVKPALKMSTKPGIEVDFALFKNLHLLLDTELDYNFMKVTFADDTDFKFLTSPIFKWGVGFRYDSSY